MNSESKITHEQLIKLLRYDPETGFFVWVIAPNRRIRVGSAVGSLNKYGYIQIQIDGARYAAHRLAWLYTYGRWPVNQIDHVNGTRNDNRFENLREATSSQNLQNQRSARTNNKIGVLGVCASRGKFQAQIRLNGKAHFLGRHATPEDAHSAYLDAKRKLHEFVTI